MSAWVVALDGGGTKTVAAVADADGRVLAIGRAGGSNPAFVPLAEAQAAVRCALVQAVERSGVRAAAVARVTACLSGPMRVADIVSDVFPAAGLRVVPEWVVCLASAYERDRGAVVLAGTGAFEWAVGPAGAVHADGFGLLLGDEGSAYWLALEGFRAVGRALDGRGPDTCLAPVLGPLARTLYRRGQSLARHEVAGAAPLVTEAAARGDGPARAACRLAANRLMGGLRLCMTKAGLCDGEPVTVALCGGVLRHSEAVRAPLVAALARFAPTARATVPALDPLRGAVLMALQDLGRPWESDLRAHVEASMGDPALEHPAS